MAIFAWPCVLSNRPLLLWWLSPLRGGMPMGLTVKSTQLLKIKAQVASILAKGCIFMTVCVCYLTCHDYPSLVEGESHGILLLLLLLLLLLS